MNTFATEIRKTKKSERNKPYEKDHLNVSHVADDNSKLRAHTRQ